MTSDRQAREDTRGRLYRLVWPAKTPYTDTSDKPLPEPAPHTLQANTPHTLDTERRHYLATFDKGKSLALYHTKRVASPGQRIVLYAKDRGCSHPGCDVSGYYCQVHHLDDWANTFRTDIDQLTLACGPHHRLLDKGWTTRKRANGDNEWIPPPHLDHGQPRVNTFHHPEKLLAEDGDDP